MHSQSYKYNGVIFILLLFKTLYMYIQIAFTNAVYTQVTVKSHGPFCVMKYQLGTNKNTKLFIWLFNIEWKDVALDASLHVYVLAKVLKIYIWFHWFNKLGTFKMKKNSLIYEFKIFWSFHRGFTTSGNSE